MLNDISISFKLAIPVEMIIGFLVCDTFLIKGKSVISKEEILYTGQFNFSKKSTAVSSKGVLKIFIPIFFAYSNNSLCHLSGV